MDETTDTGARVDVWHNFEVDVRRMGSSAGGRCGVAVMLDLLTEEQRAVVQRMLGSKMVTTAGLHRALVKRLGEQNTPKDHTIARHRRGTCSCNKPPPPPRPSVAEYEPDVLTEWPES